MKLCSRCNQKKEISCFSSNGNGIKSQCKPCNSETQKEQRRRNKKTYLKGKWVAMKSRVDGKCRGCVTAVGKEIIGKDVFIKWALSNKDFNSLFDSWVLSGFSLQKSPSIDRVNVNKGYTLDNMEFIEFCINHTKDRKKTYVLVSPEGETYSGIGMSDFCKDNNLLLPGVSELLNGKRKQYKGWVLP